MVGGGWPSQVASPFAVDDTNDDGSQSPRQTASEQRAGGRRPVVTHARVPARFPLDADSGGMQLKQST